MMFYGRKDELALLDRLQGGFRVVVTGRRQVGKTRLIREAFPDCIYLFASEEKSEKLLAQEWVKKLGHRGYIPNFGKVTEIIEFLLQQPKEVLFIDEVQNLAKIDPAIISRLQELIDANGEAKMVFCGSYVSVINKMFTEKKSPLYGRTHLLLKLEELPKETVFKICKDLDLDFIDTMMLHSIFGGMPKYYEIMEKMQLREIKEILQVLFFNDIAPLRNEGTLLLRNEFGGEFRIYFSILEAISMGKCTLTEIADFTGIRPQSLSKYIVALKDDFNLIRRVVPITERDKRSKKGRYFIKNNFYNFWFRFIHRNLSDMEDSQWDKLLRETTSQLPEITGKNMEQTVKSILLKEYPTVGPWWNRKGDEIDLIAIDKEKNEALFVEVKWKNRKSGTEIVDRLYQRSEIVDISPRLKKRYLLVSKSGFTKKILERMEDEKVLHWDLEDIEARMVRS